MIIIGAKGFAKEVLEVIFQADEVQNIYFYDDVNPEIPDMLFDRFTVLKKSSDAKRILNEDPTFCLGIGGPEIRQRLSEKFTFMGGKLTSVISPIATIGEFGNSIGIGSCIMTGVVLTSCISLGEGCLINLNCTIGHDCQIGKYVEMSPGVHVSGNCIIGDYCNLGTNATLLPKVRLGNNVVVGAGAVVTRNVDDNTTVVGIPAKPLVKI